MKFTCNSSLAVMHVIQDEIPAETWPRRRLVCTAENSVVHLISVKLVTLEVISLSLSQPPRQYLIPIQLHTSGPLCSRHHI
jgi:hypothetical protein